VAEVRRLAAAHGAPVQEIGTVGGAALEIGGIATVSLEAMRNEYETAIPKVAGEG